MLGEQFDFIAFFFGLFLIIFYKKVGIMTAKFNERFLASIPPKVKYSKKDIKATQYMFLIFGSIITLVLIVDYLGIINVN